MSVIRVGSTSSYAEGWDAVFGAAKVGRGAKAAGRAGARQARKAASTNAKRVTKAKPKAVKAARKGRKQQSARKKR